MFLGPDDGAMFIEAVKELHEWLNSTEPDRGVQLFKSIGKSVRERER